MYRYRSMALESHPTHTRSSSYIFNAPDPLYLYCTDTAALTSRSSKAQRQRQQQRQAVWVGSVIWWWVSATECESESQWETESVWEYESEVWAVCE